jgi:5-methylcytosine-specific restriction endonuclease McrA
MRNYRREYDTYHGTPKQRRNRSQRNKARRMLAKAGRVRKGDGKEVDHKRPLSKGGTNGRSNLRVVPRSVNRRKASY